MNISGIRKSTPYKMRMGKESPHKQSSPPIFFQIKQRTKKSPITIEGYIGIEEGCIIKGKQGFKEIVGEQKEEGGDEQERAEEKKRKVVDGFKLKVTVNSADWGKLWSYCLHNQKDFAKHFWSDLIYPAMKELETKRGARRSKKSQQLITWIWEYASFLYAFFLYWFKQPIEEWPDYFKKLITMAENEGYVICKLKVKGENNLIINKIIGRGTNAPYRLTKYCIEKTSGEEIKKYGLRLFSEPSYFLKKYIHKNRSVTKIDKFAFKNKSREEMANLAYQLPLKYLFEYLHVI